MLIAVDVDDVVAELVGEWVSYYNRMCEQTLSINDITQWYLDKSIKCEDHKHLAKDIVNPLLYNTVRPVHRALSCIRQLKIEGHDILFVTTATSDTMSVKFEWLKAQGFTCSEKDYITTAHKGLLNVDVMVDDYPANFDDFSGLCILYNRPWNATYLPKTFHNFGRYFRADNWMEILKIIRQYEASL